MNPENIIFQCQQLEQQGQGSDAVTEVKDLATMKAFQDAEDRADLARVRARLDEMLKKNQDAVNGAIGELYKSNHHP